MFSNANIPRWRRKTMLEKERIWMKCVSNEFGWNDFYVSFVLWSWAVIEVVFGFLFADKIGLIMTIESFFILLHLKGVISAQSIWCCETVTVCRGWKNWGGGMVESWFYQSFVQNHNFCFKTCSLDWSGVAPLDTQADNQHTSITISTHHWIVRRIDNALYNLYCTWHNQKKKTLKNYIYLVFVKNHN